MATAQERKIYVGNLDPRATETVVQQFFAQIGEVVSIKIIPDKNFQNGGLNYGFVEFRDQRTAEAAVQQFNGKKLFNTEIRVNWAFQGSNKEEGFHIFVGDLGQEVNDQLLGKTFSAVGHVTEARVMWDPNSGKSRGYGFVTFKEKQDAERAMQTMNGEWIGSRPVRVNWANQKSQQMSASHQSFHNQQFNQNTEALKYESVVAQTSSFNTTVYIGNLSPTCSQLDLVPLFQNFGFIVEIKVHPERGYGFLKLDTHENAAMSICSLNGTIVHGRPLKCSWGKDKGPGDGNFYGMNQQNGYGYPQYGMPQYGYYPPGRDDNMPTSTVGMPYGQFEQQQGQLYNPQHH